MLGLTKNALFRAAMLFPSSFRQMLSHREDRAKVVPSRRSDKNKDDEVLSDS